jgi:hypothetical protein
VALLQIRDRRSQFPRQRPNRAAHAASRDRLTALRNFDRIAVHRGPLPGQARPGTRRSARLRPLRPLRRRLSVRAAALGSSGECLPALAGSVSVRPTGGCFQPFSTRTEIAHGLGRERWRSPVPTSFRALVGLRPRCGLQLSAHGPAGWFRMSPNCWSKAMAPRSCH